MKRLLPILLLTGCGGSFNLSLAGDWVGPANLAIQGGQIFAYQGSLHLNIPTNDILAVQKFCLDGNGEVDIHGEGNTATWKGEAICSPAQAGTFCGAMIEVFQTASLSLHDNTLMVEATGTTFGCEKDGPFILLFTAQQSR